MLLVYIREAFDVNPADSDHRDLKVAPGGTRMTIASRLRLQWSALAAYLIGRKASFFRCTHEGYPFRDNFRSIFN